VQQASPALRRSGGAIRLVAVASTLGHPTEAMPARGRAVDESRRWRRWRRWRQSPVDGVLPNRDEKSEEATPPWRPARVGRLKLEVTPVRIFQNGHALAILASLLTKTPKPLLGRAERVRTDQRLAELGLVSSRSRARASILAGQVFWRGRRLEKPSEGVPPDAELELRTGRGSSRVAATSSWERSVAWS